MAAEITSRHTDSSTIENVTQEPSNDDGYLTVDNPAGDFAFVLLHALELFGEFQDNSKDDDMCPENSQQNVNIPELSENESTIELQEFSSNGNESSTESEESFEDIQDTMNIEEDNKSTVSSGSLTNEWEIVEVPEGSDIDSTIQEISLSEENGTGARLVDIDRSDPGANLILEEDHCQMKGDLGSDQIIAVSESDIQMTIEEETNYEVVSQEDLNEETQEECNNKEQCKEITDKIRSMKFNFFTHKNSKHKAKKKKWKPFPRAMLGFDFRVLNSRTVNECCDPEMLQDFDDEFAKFENELNSKEIGNSAEEAKEPETAAATNEMQTEKLKNGVKEQEKSVEICASNDLEQSVPTAEQPKPSESDDSVKTAQPETNKNTPKKRKRHRPKKDHAWDKYDTFNFENAGDEKMLEKILDRTLAKLERFEGKNAEKRLRRKKKWNYIKTHKAKRANLGYGRQVYTTMSCIYVNRRVFSNLYQEGHLQRRNIVATRRLKDIDKTLATSSSLRDAVNASRQVQIRNPGRPHNQQNNQNNRQNGGNQRPPRYALNNNNADNGLDPAMVQILINLQDRDLTPEDYDLLLRLDDRVAAPTVEKGLVDSLVSDLATEEDVGESCSICMEHYVKDQKRKYLPCGHIFHADCITQWLTNASQNCPLDNMPVVPS